MIYLIFFLFSLGQLGRLSFFNQEINIYLYEILAACSILLLVLKYRLEPLKEAYQKYKEYYIFFGLMWLSYLIGIPFYSYNQNIVAVLYFMRLMFYFAGFLYLAQHLKSNLTSRRQFVKGILFTSLLIFLFSLLQYFLYPNLRNLFYLGWDPHLYRVFGLFFDTSLSASIFGIITLYLFLNFKKIKIANYAKSSLLIVYSSLGLLTYSRGFYLAMATTLIVYLVSRKKFLHIFILLIMFFSALLVLPREFGEGVNLVRTFSIESRVREDKIALSIWQKKPLLGIGYNRIRYEKEKLGIINNEKETVSHSMATFPSSFLIVLATGGILGLLAFVLVLFKLSKISEAAQYLIIFISIFSLFDNVLLHPFVLFLIFSILGIEQTIFSYRANSLH